MKFEELKELWENDNPNQKVIHEDTVRKTVSKVNPLIKLKKTMLNEFILTWIIIVGLIIYLNYYPFLSSKFFGFYYILLNLAVISTIYYNFLFYKFYSNKIVKGIATFENLIELNAEFKINLHLYRSYNYIVAILISPIFICYKLESMLVNFSAIESSQLHIIMFFFVLFIVLVVIIGEIWIYYFYGKYFKEFEKIKSELAESQET